MPLTNYAFADLITFTRSTTATFVGSNGLIQSAAINAPRFDFSPVTLAPLGILIEEQRVNLLLYSAEFDNAGWTKTNGTITANATTAPDGTLTADKHVPDLAAVLGIGATETRVQQNVTATIGTSYTFSIYAKAGEFDRIEVGILATPTVTAMFSLASGTVVSGTGASITPAGNGWYRCIFTVVAGATGALSIRWSAESSTVSIGDGTSGIFAWGAQVEAGAFATSYIPTVASTVTRARDVATITGADFSPWYNANEGTFVVSFTSRPTAVALVANDGSFNNRLPQMGIGATSLYENFIVAGGSVVATLNPSGTHVFGTPATVAAAYAVNNYAASANGGTVVTDTSGALPTGINNLNMGSLQTGGSSMNGYLRNITYYPTRLTDAQLQALTA